MDTAAEAVPHAVAAVFLDHARPGIRFPFEPILEAGYIVSHPINAVHRFTIFDLIQRFGPATNNRPTCACDVPYPPPRVIIDHDKRRSAKVRLSLVTIDNWAFEQAAEGNSIIFTDGYANGIAIRHGHTGIPADIVEIFLTAAVHDAAGCRAAVIKRAQLPRRE